MVATVVTIVYASLVTYILYVIVDKTMGVRVARKEEAMGLDLTQHNERAYTMLE